MMRICRIYLTIVTDMSVGTEVNPTVPGSGKSHFIGQKLVLKALKSKRKILIVRKVGTTLRDSCFQLIKDALVFFKIYEQCQINKTDMMITLMNGSLFIFKSMDDPEKIKSIAGITDIWVEESSECTLDDISQLDLRLRAKADYLQIFFSFNPVSKDNWVYKYFHRDDPDTTPESMLVVKTTYTDNKFLPQSYIDSLESMKDTNPTYYEIYVKGSFASLDKLVFPNHEVMDFDWREKVAEGGKAIFGLDFGFVADSTAFVCSVINETKKEIYIFDEWFQKAATNNQIAGAIIDKGFMKEVIVADCQNQKDIEDLKFNYNLSRIKRSWKGKGSVLTGINYLQMFKIYVHPNCENILTELRNYSWKKNKNTNEYINEPIDAWNHGLDALRYSVQSVRRGKVTTLSKKALGL